MRQLSYAESVSALYQKREHADMHYRLEDMRAACAALENPQRSFRSLHIAGTNGKGSAACMAATIFGVGRRVGLYTSPHLIDIRERIQVDGEPITPADFARLYVRVAGFGLSFFETVTLIAFLYFAERHVDLAVIEVGLGGRLDATNVLDGDVAAITSIGLDHISVLGDTPEHIATEKAGIIKHGQDVVITTDNRSLSTVFEETTRERGARIHWAAPYTGRVGMRGPVQRLNAGVAAAACRLLGASETDIEHGIAVARWPGRFERVGQRLIVDGAHNAQALERLGAFLRSEGMRPSVVFGTSQGRPADTASFLPSSALILTQSGQRFATPVSLLAGERKEPDLRKALLSALESCLPGEDVLVTGSLYLVGDVFALLREDETLRHAFGVER